MAMMRLVMARLILEFNMTLAEKSQGWVNKVKLYSGVVKRPLYVHLKPVQR